MTLLPNLLISGGALIVWRADLYRNEGHLKLGDTTFYSRQGRSEGGIGGGGGGELTPQPFWDYHIRKTGLAIRKIKAIIV